MKPTSSDWKSRPGPRTTSTSSIISSRIVRPFSVSMRVARADPFASPTGGVDGVITDYPRVAHQWLAAEGYSLPPLPSPKQVEKIDKCLAKHLVKTTDRKQ